MFNLNKIKQINVMRTLILVGFTTMILACASQQEVVNTNNYPSGESAAANETKHSNQNDSIINRWLQSHRNF